MWQACSGKEDRLGDWRSWNGPCGGRSCMRRGNPGPVCGNAGAGGRVAGAQPAPWRCGAAEGLTRRKAGARSRDVAGKQYLVISIQYLVFLETASSKEK